MTRKIRIGIDASNLRAGGGRTHLIEVLSAATDLPDDVDSVVVWGSRETIDALPGRSWLRREHEPALDGSLVKRVGWQRFVLPRRAREMCDVLWVPGGLVLHDIRPRVVMCQNMLPFDASAKAKYGIGVSRLRLELLRCLQGRSFRSADGVMFLHPYAQTEVSRLAGLGEGDVFIVPHGVGDKFASRHRTVFRRIETCSEHEPFRLLYVSILGPYKHQVEVLQAVAALRADGFPVHVHFVGAPGRRQDRAVFDRARAKLDPAGAFSHYHGLLPTRMLIDHYAAADACVFASSCENLPNILLEAMKSGAPLVCSDRPPMPDVLGDDGGVYFNPESPSSLVDAMRKLWGMSESEVRDMVQRARHRADRYTWQQTWHATVDALVQVCRRDGERRC
jgi:glycosyltransferase involved in cell wall biosynthesis